MSIELGKRHNERIYTLRYKYTIGREYNNNKKMSTYWKPKLGYLVPEGGAAEQGSDYFYFHLVRDPLTGTLRLPIHDLRRLEIEVLDLEELGIPLPNEIGELINLYTLNVCRSRICSIPPSIGKLQNLRNLKLSYLNVAALPSSIGDLHCLSLLDCSHTQIRTLPREIGNLKNLFYLDLRGTMAEELPNEIGNLPRLCYLDLQNTKISVLPPSIGRLTNLDGLGVPGGIKSHLPSLRIIAGLPSLVQLCIHGEKKWSGVRRAVRDVWYYRIVAMRRLFGSTPHHSSASEGTAIVTEAPKPTFKLSPNLWPLLLGTPKNVFRGNYHKVYPRPRKDCQLSEPEAIYELLVLARPSFEEIFIRRAALPRADADAIDNGDRGSSNGNPPLASPNTNKATPVCERQAPDNRTPP